MQYVNSLWWVWKFFYCRWCWYWHIHFAAAAAAAVATDNAEILMCAWNNGKRTLNLNWKKYAGLKVSLVNAGGLLLKSTYQNAWAIDAFFTTCLIINHISFDSKWIFSHESWRWCGNFSTENSRHKNLDKHFIFRLSAVVSVNILFCDLDKNQNFPLRSMGRCVVGADC